MLFVKAHRDGLITPAQEWHAAACICKKVLLDHMLHPYTLMWVPVAFCLLHCMQIHIDMRRLVYIVAGPLSPSSAHQVVLPRKGQFTSLYS